MDETRIGRIIFRAWRRGFREADLILGPFAETHVRSMDEAQLSAFEALLGQEDQDLYAWITGAVEAPAAFEGPMLSKLIEFGRSLPVARGDLSGS